MNPSPGFSIMDIINIRLGLDQIKAPSQDIVQTIATLDRLIAHMCSGFQPNIPATTSPIILNQ